MSVSLLDRSTRAIAAGALTLIVSVAAQPALAANQGEQAETMPVAGGFVDEHLSPLVSSSARLLKERTQSARRLIQTGDVAAALKEVNAAQDSAGAVRSLIPFVVAVKQLDQAKDTLLAGDLPGFRRDLLPIYARLDEMSVFAPDVAAQAKGRLKEAESDVDTWKINQAVALLDETSNAISGSAAYIPAVDVYTELAAAHSALSAKEPDIASARTAVRNADELLSLVVTSTPERQSGRT